MPTRWAYVRQPHRPFFTSLLLGLALLALTTPGVLAETDDGEPVGVEDLAGVLVVEEQTLYVFPEDLEGVLEALGAEPLEDGWYTTTYEASTLLPAGLGVAYQPTTVIFKALVPGGWGTDGLPVDFVGDGGEGVFLRAYRDARCGRDGSRPGAWELMRCVTTGGPFRSMRLYLGPRAVCKKSPGGYCVEYPEPDSIEFHYSDTACTQLVGAEATIGFHCKMP